MIEQFFPREYHSALKFLGTKDWLQLEIVNNRTVLKFADVTKTVEDRRRYRPEDFSIASDILEQYCLKGSTEALFTQTVSKSILDGPKLFRPTMEQCQSLENTEANVGFDFYQQPFQSVILELPKNYQAYLKSEYATDIPPYVLCYKHPNGMLAITAWFDKDNVIVNVMSPLPEYKTIEDAIVKNRRTDDSDYKMAEIVQRLGINFSLMMTMLGTKIVGPLNPAAYKLQKNALKSGNEKKAERARKFLESTVFLCEFEQKITFYEQEDTPHAPSDGTGEDTHRSPKPHWRRGHFRQQPYGPGSTLRKLTFIKPIMVMAKYFSGDLSDTIVTYKAKDVHK